VGAVQNSSFLQKTPVSAAGVFSLMGALSVRDGGDHRSKKFAPIEMPKAGHRFVADSSLEGNGFELSVPRERGYRLELSSVIYVPETVRVLPNKYTGVTVPAALVELHQNAKRSPCHRRRP
jgi:hypothetical protein